MPLLLLTSNLRVEVGEAGLYVQYFPFHRAPRRIVFAELESATARSYNPIREYGGWGLRGGARNGAFNVSGNEGVQLVFTNGNRLLIGSQRAAELAVAIRDRGDFTEVQRNTVWWLLLIAALCFAMLPCFWFMGLNTEVRRDGLYVRFVPFHLRYLRFGYEDLRSFEARTYSPIGEYGGWGIRGWGREKAYNVSGNRGVQLVFHDERRLLIGSQQADELANAMHLAGGR